MAFEASNVSVWRRVESERTLLPCPLMGLGRRPELLSLGLTAPTLTSPRVKGDPSLRLGSSKIGLLTSARNTVASWSAIVCKVTAAVAARSPGGLAVGRGKDDDGPSEPVPWRLPGRVVCTTGDELIDSVGVNVNSRRG